MQRLVIVITILMSTALCQAQSIVGRWQLVSQSVCMDDESDDETGPVSGEPRILELRANNTGQETARIISKRKSYNPRTLLYRYSDGSLYFLDKRTQTLIEGYTVEKIENDSLIISNVSHVCETRVFVRARDNR